VGSLTANADPAFPYRGIFGPVYPASKTALNALTLAMAIELEPEGIKVNAVSPGYTRTNLNGYSGMETVEQGAREAVRVALLGSLDQRFARASARDDQQTRAAVRRRRTARQGCDAQKDLTRSNRNVEHPTQMFSFSFMWMTLKSRLVFDT
jgi:NAD(P)-dependent dehydrogenase (short-subunit alcohol dehydrogenase family)